MLETTLQVGAPSWLPRDEAGQAGAGGLCSHGVQNGIYNGHHKYLPFVPNGINWVASAGEDVISFNFSGCTMAVYKDGGVVKVCHVSTGAGQDCSAAWDLVKAGSVNVFEFKPFDFIETNGAAIAGCYGLITADLRTYTITIVRPASTQVNTVASVKTARLLR
jgi:hypothetical protein